jgi:hypothetical protein
MSMALVLNKGWTTNYKLRLTFFFEREFNHALSCQFSCPWSPSKFYILGVLDSSPNLTFTSLLHGKIFSMENSMVICLFSSPTLDLLWSSKSLGSKFFLQTLTSLHSYIEKNFLKESLITFYFLSRKNLKFTLQPKVVNCLNLPIAKMVHETYV